MPSYNEEKNLLELINKIHINLIDKYIYEIVVVDDNSNDETKALITSIKKKYNIKYIKNHINMGQSFSSHLGIKNSIYETIVTIDADGQNDPADIHKLADYYFKNNISLVGGLRLKRKDNLVKILSSRIANYVRNYYLNDNCLDTGCSLKVFDKKSF